MSKSLIVACDGEAASGKSTGAKLLSKKYKLLLLNSGLLYRYASKILITKKPKKPKFLEFYSFQDLYFLFSFLLFCGW